MVAARKDWQMLSTKEVVARLAAANPEEEVTEERIRRALRTGAADAPDVVAGRLVWREDAIVALAKALGLSWGAEATPSEGDSA